MEDPFASGRYLCCHEKSIRVSQMAQMLAKAFPNYPVPTKLIGTPVPELQFDNSKLKKLFGRDLIPIDKSLTDMVHSLIQVGLVKKY
jgi:nucleoside-diphosphate-sugar epimerase